MKKINKLTATSLFVIATSLLAPSAANAVVVGSGTNCEAANLNQALAGIGWSQSGVQNNATSSFFVVCPTDWDSTNGTSNNIAVLATFPGNSGTVECTARAQIITGSYTSSSFTVSAGQGGLGANRGIANTAVSFSGALNGTVVCALEPGQGVETAYSY